MRKLTKFSQRSRMPFILLAAALTAYAPFSGAGWGWWLAAFLAYEFFYMGLGLSVGMHRYWAHRSFKASRAWEYVMMASIIIQCAGLPLVWAHVHRRHHLTSDTPTDPHRLHVNGWRSIYRNYDMEIGRSTLQKLLGDPLHRVSYEYFFAFVAAFALLLWLIGGLEALIFLWAIPTLISHLLRKFLFVYGIHRIGTQRFDTGDDSRNSALIALLAAGEGWHNNHHRHPGRARFGIRWWELDPGAWIVALIRTDRAHG